MLDGVDLKDSTMRVILYPDTFLDKKGVSLEERIPLGLPGLKNKLFHMNIRF